MEQIVIDSIFLQFIEYIFGDWWVWLRFTITIVFLRRVMGDAIVKGSTAFWQWATGIFKKNT